MSTRVEDPTGEITIEDQEAFLTQLASDIETDPAELVRVTIDVTAASQEFEANCIDIHFPSNGVDLDRKLSFAQARQLSIDLTTAGVFVRDLRLDKGWTS